MAVGRVGADQHHHIGLLDRVEILRAGRGAERGAQSVAGRRMADAGAGVGVVVAEHVARQLLHQVGLFVGAARRGDDADRILAGRRLDALELGGDAADRLFPRDLAPWVGDLLAHHRLEHAVLVVGVAPGEAALHAGMPVIRLAVLPRHHAHHRVALHLGLEVAADAAIGAGGDDGMLGLAEFDHGLLEQRTGRAGLHAGAARHAFAGQERFARAGGDLRGEAAAFDGEREGVLGFLARAHAARADDAARRIELEVGIGCVDLGMQVIDAALAVAHLAHADQSGHLLEFAVAGDRRGEAVQRVIGQVQFHHAAAYAAHALAGGGDLHARCNRRGAGCRRSGAAFDFAQAHAAGAECVQRVGGAQLRDADARFHRRAHDRCAGGDGHFLAVDHQRHLFGGGAFRCAVVEFVNQGHGYLIASSHRPSGRPRLCLHRHGRRRPAIHVF